MKEILFAPLSKVVELPDGTLEVWGRAAAQEPDSSGEVFDYEASKPFIKTWSDGIFEASGGQSVGNLRAMHNPKIAAGKLTKLDFIDAEKAVDVVANVIDAEEVKKTLAGVYTGFSFGGKYGPKRQAGGLVYYPAIPSELSLADNPMIKSARFTLVKTDGSEEVREFTKVEAPGALQKRLYDVGKMADRLYDLRCLLGNIIYEAQEEQDGSTVPARLQAAFLNLVEIFKDFAAEEAEEMAVNVRQLLEQPLAMNTAAGDLAKAGARHTAAELLQIQQIHDMAASLGAACGGMEKTMKPEELQKLNAVEEGLAKLEAANTALSESLAKVETENQELKGRLAKVEAQPAPAAAAVRAVDKEADTPLGKTDGPTQDEMIKNKDTQGLIKAAHANPIGLT